MVLCNLLIWCSPEALQRHSQWLIFPLQVCIFTIKKCTSTYFLMAAGLSPHSIDSLKNSCLTVQLCAKQASQAHYWNNKTRWPDLLEQTSAASRNYFSCRTEALQVEVVEDTWLSGLGRVAEDVEEEPGSVFHRDGAEEKVAFLKQLVEPPASVFFRQILGHEGFDRRQRGVVAALGSVRMVLSIFPE